MSNARRAIVAKLQNFSNFSVHGRPLAETETLFYTITMIYFAHRGLPALRVQNTTESFALARQKGAKYYELDVHLLKDGALVVHHDYSLLNTAGFDVKLADLTMADLKKYPLKNPFTNTTLTVPLLEDIIPLVLPELEILNIEIKNDDNVYPGIESVLLRALKKWPEIAPKILFSGFDYDSLVRLRALDKNARIGLLTRAFDVSKALALGAESVHINQTRLTQEVVRVCHQNNLKVEDSRDK